MRYALSTRADSTHGCHVTKPPVVAQHNANADAVADMENSLRVCILPKSHTPDGAAGYDAFVFDDSNV